MSLFAPLSNLWKRTKLDKSDRKKKRSRSIRPALEILEDRTVPTVFLNNPGNFTEQAGSTVNISLQAYDSLGNSLTYSAAGLPSWLSLSGSTISGTVAGNGVIGSPF